MTVLSHQTIKAKCSGPKPLVYPACNRQIKTASYDLRLGPEHYLGGTSPRVARLCNAAPALEIDANQVVLVRTLENVDMPYDIVGHLSLKLDVLLKGLIISSQSQIDAGYKGPIFALLYNLNDSPVTLQLRQSLLRLEFTVLDEPTVAPYKGDWHPNFTLSNVVTSRLTSSLAALRHAFARTRRFSFYAGLTVFIALVTLGATYVVPFIDTAADAGAAAEKHEKELEQLRADFLEQQAELDRLSRERSSAP